VWRRIGAEKEAPMPNYYIRLIGPGSRGRRVVGSLLRDTLDVLVRGSSGAVRLRFEGKSGGPGRTPRWVGVAAQFEFLGLREGSTVIELEAPAFGDVIENQLAQEEMFDEVPRDASGLGLFRESLEDALAGTIDSDHFDPELLETIQGWSEVLSQGIKEIEFGNATGAVTRIAQPQLDTAKRLRRETPPPQRVRVTGWLDAIRHHDRMFTLKLEDGTTLRGIAEGVQPETLGALFGKKATVSAMAVFRPSGRVLRLEADHIEHGGEDFSLWSAEPQPLDQPLDERALRQPQGPRSGLNAIIGQWPGDETDEEIFRALEDLS